MKKSLFLIILVVLLTATMATTLIACNQDEPPQQPQGPTTYTVTFDSLGGCAVGSQEIEKGKFAQEPTAPVREGYIFSGWYDLNGTDDGEWGDKWEFAQFAINADITLYAKWEEVPETYTATFYDGSEVYDKQENLSEGEIVVEPTAPTATDKIFIGWFLSTDGGVTLGAQYDFSTPVSANIDLYAKWQDKLFINLNYNGATHETQVARLEVSDGVQYKLPRPLKSESTFLGWFDANDTKYELQATFEGNQSIELTAKWEDGTAGLTYETNDNFAKVIGASSTLTEIVVPESYNGLYVTEIAANAFSMVTGLKKITFCEGITDIGEGAFYSASAPLMALCEVNLPSTLKNIGIDAFNGTTALKRIKLNEGLEVISQRAFKSSGLEEITIPSTVARLYDGVFNECGSLRKITFTRDINAEGGITVPHNNAKAILRQNKAGLIMFVPANSVSEYKESWAGMNQWQMTGQTAIFSVELADADEIVVDGVLYGYFGNSTQYITGANVTEIYAGAFEDNTHVQSVVLSDGFVRIGASAFLGCTGLTSVTSLSETMPAIKNYNKNGVAYSKIFDDENTVTMHVSGSCYNQFAAKAGYNANAIEKIAYTVTLKDGNNTSTVTAYRYETIDFPAVDRVLGKKFVGYKSAGTTFDVTTKVTYDMEISLEWEICNVYTVSFVTFTSETINEQKLNEGEKAVKPQNPTPEGESLFEGWYLSDDNGVTLMTEFDFDTVIDGDITLYAKYSTVDTKSVITLDYNGATHEIGATEISKSVGETFELPRPYRNDATFLGWFDEQDNKHAMNGTVENVDDYTLTAKWQLASEGLEYVLSDKGTNYAVKLGTCTETDIVIPEWHNGYVVDMVGASGFESKDITSVVLPEGIKTINQRAFFSTKLKEVVIPSTVTTIGNGAFNRSAELKKVTILRSSVVDGSITGLGNTSVFRLTSPGIVIIVPFDSVSDYKADTKWLTQLTRWENAERVFSSEDIVDDFIVRDGTLYGYVGNSLDIVVPSNVTKIADGAFHGSNANTITLHDGITSIGAMAFANMTEITEMTMPTGLASIGARAFDGCSNLTKVTFTSATAPTITSVQIWSGKNDVVSTVSDIFTDSDTVSVVVPVGSGDTYRAVFTNANVTEQE